MALFSTLPDDAIFLTRDDSTNPLASFSKHEFELEGHQWPSVEHYFHAMKFTDVSLQKRIRELPHPTLCLKTARWNFWRVRKDWKKIQRVVMTRAMYTKCRTHPEVSEALLATGDVQIIEASLYDYYWGLGRDHRGHNYYGKMLMDVRQRLRQEAG